MSTAAELPRRFRATVRRSDVMTVLEQQTHHPGVRAVELVLVAGQVARMVVHHETGDKEELTVTEDAS